ncbi:hypothetical protein K461DRAFT_126594 [Myriangium duriaei CBS 260.36]|uniref:Plasma membrane fusion protein PRM1 n=1 Tax=Myriangium duriaei CBS 260.36 TaxID=1168546 RepID=A0A9P4MH32_9PEZI|nr:hypothetical protein K461DRAFT_126594 [Myriangium duriaei CBS 260.36]
MSSAPGQQHTFPVAPPSPSAGVHEMRDCCAAHAASRPLIQPSSQPTPYLGLPARLSQVWINRWTILLLLVLIRTILAIADLDNSLGSARTEALSACTKVENVGSALASMPHYLSGGVNDLTAHGIDKAVNGLMHMLILSVTGVEEIAVFVVNMMISTYVCLITFAVGGSLHIAIQVAEEVGNFLNTTVKNVGGDLSKAASGLETAMNGFLSDVNKLGSLFTGKTPSAPTVDFTSEINALNGLQLPTGYDQGLSKLNASIPNFADVKNFTNNLIRFPFEEVKQLLNHSLPNYSMNRSIFPVPQREQLTFCSDNNGIEEFFVELIKIERIARKVFIAVLLVAMVIACVPMAYREIRRWRSLKQRIAVMRTEAVDEVDAAYIVSRPYTASAGIYLASKCASRRGKTMVRFAVAYATTIPALFVLSLALAGLLACLCQYILLKTIEKEVPALTNQVGAFADKVVNSLTNASEQWSIGTNQVINQTNAKINQDVFGWVNTTTGAINNTLNEFVDGMTKGLNMTFGGTPLYDPVMEVLNCLVLLKVQGIEKALTWVSDNAYITFPELPTDTFSAGALDRMSENGNNSLLATGPDNEASDAISNAVLKVTKHLEGMIRQEAIISTSILMIWVIIALIGITHAAMMAFRQRKDSPITSAAPRSSEDNSLDGAGSSINEKSSALANVPSYEQATFGNADSHGNKFRGQTYTLTPQPLPTFRIVRPAMVISQSPLRLILCPILGLSPIRDLAIRSLMRDDEPCSPAQPPSSSAVLR